MAENADALSLDGLVQGAAQIGTAIEQGLELSPVEGSGTVNMTNEMKDVEAKK